MSISNMNIDMNIPKYEYAALFFFHVHVMCVRDIEIDAVSMSRSVVYKVYYIILWTYLYI